MPSEGARVGSLLAVEGLTKQFAGTPEPVFEDVHFAMAKGTFACLVGHSGCGKTSILNVLAGLEAATAGHVLFDAREIAGPSLDRGVVFQGHALLPWLTVRANIAFAVRSRWPGWDRARVAAHVEKYVALVGLTAAIDRRPAELSGGMKQRVGIARAFAIEPKMLLMDEPFGALDALTRGTIQDELKRIVRETHQTVLMITHDVDEAILLADRVLLMGNGPRARIVEDVVVTLPADRTRHGLHHEPQYYRIRNHLVDFLVERSAAYAHGKAPARPRVVTPGLDAGPHESIERLQRRSA